MPAGSVFYIHDDYLYDLSFLNQSFYKFIDFISLFQNVCLCDSFLALSKITSLTSAIIILIYFILVFVFFLLSSL